MRTRIKTYSLRTAIARWVARRLVPAVFPKINPLARALLRSPLHGLMSRHVIVLCFEGRRTGKRYETPVAYRRADDGALEALTSVHGAWWRNLESGALATVVHCGRALPAARRCCAGVRFYPTRGERRGGQARAGIPRPPAPRHDARPASGDRPPAYLADPRNRPLPRPSPARRSYRVRVRTAGVRCARMIVWVPADAGMTKKRGGDDGRRAGTSVSRAHHSGSGPRIKYGTGSAGMREGGERADRQVPDFQRGNGMAV